MSETHVKERARLAAWAAGDPRIRRVWLFDSDAKRKARSDTELDVAIEMEPVPDSEETIAYWIAHAEEWQDQVEKCVGTSVDLEWFDPDVDAPLGDKAILAYDRVLHVKPPPSSPPPPSDPSAPPRPR